MAAPVAYEQPTVNKAWRAFLDHLPTLAVILLCQLGIFFVALVVLVALLLTANVLLGTAAGSLDQPSPIMELIANVGQLPFVIILNLVGVLFMAVPAMHYESGLTITPSMALAALSRRPMRFLLAGLLFAVASTVGFVLCFLPGVAVALVMPVYVNRIFNTNEPILDAFKGSFHAVYQSERGFTFVWIQLLTVLVTLVLTLCTCFVGGLVVFPMASFYIQNMAYHQGVLR